MLEAIRHAPAPAKLNLMLHVLGRRPDGYHELETVFVPLDLADTLHLARRADGQVVRATEIDGVPAEGDLTVRAARLLQRESGVADGVTIEIDKRIPMGGGLGGGSSDAATVLMALNRLWRLHWPRERLAELALALGADVPFFLFGRPAYARGVGEALRPLPTHADAWLPRIAVVVSPPAHVATAAVFSSPNLTRDTKPLRIQSLSRHRSGLPGRNDLEPVVLAQSPPVAAARWALEQAMLAAGQTPSQVRMTGSGACVFAALADAGKAEAVARHVRRLAVGGVTVARVLPEHPLACWAFAKRAPLGSRQVG